MNTEWFRQLLATRKLSQRGLAKLLELDPAAVSLMLRGSGEMLRTDADVAWAARVLWIKPL